MHEVNLNDQIQFDYENEFCLLDAIEKYDANVTYSCRGGFCGACKAKLHSGKVQQVIDPLYDCNPGEVLTCCIAPASDIKISY